MIEREKFKETDFAGKNRQEIRAIIGGLERELSRIAARQEWRTCSQSAYGLEHQEDMEEKEILEQYLEQATSALVAAGGRYIPLNREKKAAAFNTRNPFITRIVLQIGKFRYPENVHWAYDVFIYNLESEHICWEQSDSPLHTEIIPYELPIKKKFPVSKQTFLQKLACLHIGGWYPVYENDVLEGVSWYLEINYSQRHRTVKKCGYSAFPPEFPQLCKLLRVQNPMR